MTLQRRIRYFVILVSVIIFCYQLKVALNNLMSDATVDSTEYIPISKLDSPPVITLCPRQGIDEAKIVELGYHIKWENSTYADFDGILAGNREIYNT